MLRYGAVAFLSAFLLFLVQPLLGKSILPWFGGAPAVWSTCLVFFQAVLLLGYAAAHLTSRLPPRRQASMYLGVLVLSIAQLPIRPPEALKPAGTETPVPLILALLALAVGLPYLLMSATAPLVQRWASRDRAVASSPYPLYAVSNAGSLLGLVAYPFLIERFFTLATQQALWSAVYAAFAVLAGWLAWTRGRREVAPVAGHDAGAPGPAPPGRTRVLWFALPAATSGLLVATTNEISLNIAVIPFLWVLPLALYLITFMLAFAGAYSRRLATPLLVVGLLWMALVNLFYVSAPAQIFAGALVLFAGAFAAHGELARLAPHPRHLTAFYLAISAGGVIGGTLVALVAPVVFDEFWEMPIFLILTHVLFVTSVNWTETRRRAVRRWAAVAGVAALVLASYGWTLVARAGDTVVTARNFFGVLRVYDSAPDEAVAIRRFQHGRIVHGLQFLDPARRMEPNAYYTPRTGIGLALQQHPDRLAGRPLRIGVIGLGVGTLAAWGRPGDTITFYEINPQVIEIARRYFTFLDETPARVEIVAGDGRLALEREIEAGQEGRFDLLVADAFSGDAVPVHLLTREAAALYWQALDEDGLLVFNVTNRYLDLAPVIRGVAAELGKEVVQVTAGARPEVGVLSSDWMIVTGNQAFLDNVAALRAPAASPPRSLVWTDSYSNLFDVLR